MGCDDYELIGPKVGTFVPLESPDLYVRVRRVRRQAKIYGWWNRIKMAWAILFKGGSSETWVFTTEESVARVIIHDKPNSRARIMYQTDQIEDSWFVEGEKQRPYEKFS